LRRQPHFDLIVIDENDRQVMCNAIRRRPDRQDSIRKDWRHSPDNDKNAIESLNAKLRRSVRSGTR
jgi:hypothetical protein